VSDTAYRTMSEVLGEPIASEADVYKLIRAGVPFASYQAASVLLGTPSGLIARRRHGSPGGHRLDEVESEGLLRVVRVYAEARDLFGTHEGALRWLSTPRTYIPDVPAIRPMELAMSDPGARLLISEINRTAHGIF